MSATNLTESETTINYVPRELFDEREAKNQAVMDKNMADIRNEIKTLNITLNARMDVLNMRIDGVEASLSMKIDNVEESLSTMMAGLINRFEDMKEHQNKWFTVFGILFTGAAIIAPVAVAIVQHYLK
ncbi:MAG: hypothetical protein IJ597_02435 [Synergistaceae bacterium]|nr:hypothetical protein [Synergistaceae bacterium]